MKERVKECLTVFKGKDFELANKMLEQRNLRNLSDIINAEYQKIEERYSKLFKLKGLMDSYMEQNEIGELGNEEDEFEIY